MAMTLDTVFLGADGSEQGSKKSWTLFRSFVCAWLAMLLLVAVIYRSPTNSEPIAMNAVGFSGAMLGAPRTTNTRGAISAFQPQLSRTKQEMISSIESNPMARLAMTAMTASNRCRDFSLKAMEESSAEVKDAASEMDGQAKGTVEEIKKAVELKAQDMAGVTGPLDFFDPLGFATNTKTGKLLFYREVELKHGRICMLASLGILVGEKFHPLFGGDIDVPSYLAFQQTPLQTFWPAVVAAIAIPEIFSIFTMKEPDTEGNFWMVREDHQPGDLGFDPLGLKPTDPKEFKEMQTKEINNGRLAMIAAAGMIAQEVATGQKLLG